MALFDAIIELGDGPANVKVANNRLPVDWTCVCYIYPTTRRLETATYSEIDRNIDHCEVSTATTKELLALRS